MIISNKINIANLGKILFKYYYIIIFSFYFLNVFFVGIRQGVLTTLIISFMSLIYFLRSPSFKSYDILILLYIIYNSMSVLLSNLNGFPLNVGFSEFVSSALPIMFYFFGIKYSHLKNSFFKVIIYSSFFMILVGLYWNYLIPDYYVLYLERLFYPFNLDNYITQKRIVSFLGSTSVSLFSTISSVISFYLFKYNFKKVYLLLNYFFVFSSLISGHRAAIIIVIITSIIIRVKNIKQYNIKKIIKFEIFSFLVLFCIYILFIGIDIQLINSIIFRFEDIFSSRSNQWFKAFNIGTSLIIGNGLGSMSHRALGYSTNLINDGAYFKIIAELGFIGFILFLGIILITITRIFYKKIDRVNIEVFIILIFLLQAIGSNSLFFQETATLFWVSLGFINSSERNLK
jgi:hypothetical protein